MNIGKTPTKQGGFLDNILRSPPGDSGFTSQKYYILTVFFIKHPQKIDFQTENQWLSAEMFNPTLHDSFLAYFSV